MDLAATDAARAIEFYTGLFGWSAQSQAANAGVFVRISHGGGVIGSLYQVNRSMLKAGVVSHWTPYVRVDDADAASRRAAALGGVVAVEPFAVDAMARIALIVDPVGAAFGLWEEP
ncbi:MAG: cfp30B [Microvirga sp.]|jgi:predicted enzyme related to lactoylglutathione lyase|nr:cfp30B [Microvirga sp.]